MDFPGGTGSNARQVVGAINVIFDTLKPLQTLTADQQKETSGPMTAEKQPTSGLLPEKKADEKTIFAAGCP